MTNRTESPAPDDPDFWSELGTVIDAHLAEEPYEEGDTTESLAEWIVQDVAADLPRDLILPVVLAMLRAGLVLRDMAEQKAAADFDAEQDLREIDATDRAAFWGPA